MDDETRLPDEEALRWTRLATRSRDRTHIGTEVDSISVHDERFALGAIFAGRFRIVARLGKGGMGEVYRADDLKLGQAVALKLLPDRLARDPARLAQFHNEVRLARTISHRNVCRTYDIGDDNGTPFLTMEYVDGDDLASLLRRIGRSPRTRPSKSRARSAPASRPRTSAECFSTPRDSIDRRSTTSLLAGCRELKPTYARPGKDESPNWPTHRYGSKRQRTAVGLVFFIVVLPWTQPTRMARPPELTMTTFISNTATVIGDLVILASALLARRHLVIEMIIAVAGIVLGLAVLLRFGLLALLVTFYTFLTLESFPATTDFSRPYASAAAMLMLAIAAVAVYGFYASRGGEPLLGRALLD